MRLMLFMKMREELDCEDDEEEEGPDRLVSSQTDNQTVSD